MELKQPPTMVEPVNSDGMIEGTMKQTFGSLITLWALAAAPTLCRAGILVACCQHAGELKVPQIASDGCCDEGEPANVPQNRECGSCVIVCDTISKPPDGGYQAGMELPAALVVNVVCVRVEPWTPRGTTSGVDFPVSGVDLPFPPSDVPLLI